MTELNERLVRLNDLRGGFWMVDQHRVNLDDLCAPAHPGKIVRVDGDPHTAIAYMFENGVEADAIAGWSSENE